jgi:hypothetical protein
MLRAVMLSVAEVVLAALYLPSARAAPAPASAYSCRGYPPAALLVQIKTRVEALRRIEREAADRLVGLDTRPYDWLLEQARAAEAAIAEPVALAAEDELRRCRNFILPLRRDCTKAATALVRVIDELNSGEASKEAKQALAQTMPNCERMFRFMPLDTRLRMAE